MNFAGMGLPGIFITAHEEEGIEERAMKAGALGYLRKPFSDEVLVGLIREALQRGRKSGVHSAGQGQGGERRR
jgi:FixJ family two-component response regulator